jgi:ABC-type lipopolysaccharide export system ATPase subunit
MVGVGEDPEQASAVASTPSVEIRGLRVRYGEVEAVSGIDLTIDRGSIVALLGPTTVDCNSCGAGWQVAHYAPRRVR